MCGIVGIVTGSNGELMDSLAPMSAAILHRGPDDCGSWVDNDARIALGHRRLSILDLSPEGHQPMTSASGRFVITFNGEMYNFAALKRELGESHRFRGGSDTEVMLAAFEEWGIRGALERFVGMFAFGVWDRRQRELTLARDRMGEKPLYLGWNGGAFLFGSELGALRAYPGFKAEIDRRSVGLMMRHGYIPAPDSIFKGIYKLTAGSLLTLRLADLISKPAIFSPSPEDPSAQLRPRRYWSLRHAAAQGIRMHDRFDERSAGEELERRLIAAVKLQMVADVPVGAFLSGGIDSSLIVSLMQAQSSTPVRTFSIGFREKGYDEAGHAAAVARHLGTKHTELYVSAKEAAEVIPLLPSIYSEPFADSSQIPTYLVARLAREQVTVSLSGDGGDELFGGYGRYTRTAELWGKVGVVPAPLRRMIAKGIRVIPARWWDRVYEPMRPILPRRLQFNGVGAKAHRVARVFGGISREKLYLSCIVHIGSPEQLVLGLPSPLGDPTADYISESCPNLQDYMMLWDGLTYLPDDILVKVDRAGMAVSLESRMPLLDHRVVEHAWTFPAKSKIVGGETKSPLRKILYEHVPKELIERPKMGFGIPIDEWLVGGLRPWAEDMLAEKSLVSENLLNPTFVRQLWSEHRSGQRNWQYLLWNILALQTWLVGSKSQSVASYSLDLGSQRADYAAPFAV